MGPINNWEFFRYFIIPSLIKPLLIKITYLGGAYVVYDFTDSQLGVFIYMLVVAAIIWIMYKRDEKFFNELDEEMNTDKNFDTPIHNHVVKNSSYCGCACCKTWKRKILMQFDKE